MYGDFSRASFHQIVTFLYGCGATFVGVFIITLAPNASSEEESEQDVEEGPDTITSPGSVRMGGLGRQNRASLLLPDGVVSAAVSPVLRHKTSGGFSMIGFSPAQVCAGALLTCSDTNIRTQRVLVVHTPPRDSFIRHLSHEAEREGPNPTYQTPESVGRRRAISWVEDDATPRPNHFRRPRVRSIVGKREGSRSRDHDVHGFESPT